MSTTNQANQPERSSRRSLRYSAAVAALLIVLVIELVVPARRQSAVFDEGCHAFAGYSYWNRADFGVNPEHPPAVKLLAMLPLGKSLHFPPHQDVGFKWECFSGGKQFLYANTVSADSILIRGRIAAASLTILAALLTFALAHEMFGAAVGLLALLLFVFEPNLLAHGSLITTDMGMTAFLVATIYSFYCYVKKPSGIRLVLTGLAAGLALGAKFSGPLIFVMLPILAMCEVLRRNSNPKLVEGGRLKRWWLSLRCR
jgi:dolichyl-phosphate-mannose--protein O-mannosyl transferase